MPRTDSLAYWVAPDATLARLGEAWDAFAVENSAPELVAARVVGRSLWEFVTDATTRNLYARMIAGAHGGKTFRFPLRCDAPRLRRRLEMSLAPDDGLVRFETRLVSIEERPAQDVLERNTPRSDVLVRSCSWCGRVEHLDAWLEIDDAVVAYDLFARHPLPRLTHGICPNCIDVFERRL